jgi:hypothetical protein
MADVIFVLVTLAFFALCWLFVRGCERLVDSADEPTSTDTIS